jgi:hypothetical protein
MFGPIDFYGLDQEDFPMDQWYEEILGTLMSSAHLPADNILIHGFNILGKGKTLKRASTLLHHARFLRNLEVQPLLPVVSEPVTMEGTQQVPGDAMDGEEMDEE